MESALLSWRQRGQLWLRLGIRAVLLTAAVLLALYAAPPILSLFLPFVLALLLAWALNPLVRWLKGKLPISRSVVTLAVLILVFAAVGGLCYALVYALLGQVRSLFDNWAYITESVSDTIDTVGDWLRRLGDKLPAGLVSTGDDLLNTVTGWLKGLDLSRYIRFMAGQATDLVSAVPSFAIASVVFILASYFIISGYPTLRYAVTDQMPRPLRSFGGQLRDVFVGAFGGYIKSQLLLSLAVFGILTAGFLLMGQPYGLLLAAGLAALDFIPIIGSGTVMIPWAVVDLITGDYSGAAWLAAIWGVVAVFRQVAEPKVLGNQTGLTPILSLVGIYVGMRAGGVLGMILGPTLLLVVINLSRLGVFRPVASDLRMAARDVAGILRGGRQEGPPEIED